jgi:hypothetical protein
MVSTCDLRTYQSHQRNIVRHFAPHLTNEQLTRQENFYLMICIVRVLFVFALPTICVVYLVSWFIKTPIFFLIIVISIIHLLVALVSIYWFLSLLTRKKHNKLHNKNNAI